MRPPIHIGDLLAKVPGPGGGWRKRGGCCPIHGEYQRSLPAFFEGPPSCPFCLQEEEQRQEEERRQAQRRRAAQQALQQAGIAPPLSKRGL
jgi:hypothetical protein